MRAPQRRASIIAAAQEVFARTNLQGARTRDIARAAGVNQATVFEHFPSKEALFEAAVVEPLVEAMRGMHERLLAYQSARSAAELASLAQAATERHMREMARIFPLLIAALFSDLERGRAIYAEHIAPLIHERGLVLAGLASDGIDPELVGLAHFGMLFAVGMDRFFLNRQEDLAALTAQLSRLPTGGSSAAEAFDGA